jgi:hypothetical protein
MLPERFLSRRCFGRKELEGEGELLDGIERHEATGEREMTWLRTPYISKRSVFFLEAGATAG